jgi:hypothetical protein
MASLVDRQVARARRRLVLGSLVRVVAWLWVAALVLAAAWFFAGPLLAPDATDWLRWAVLGALVALATAGGIALALRRGPSPVAAALSLDERFGLKERVVTSLTLSDEQAATPAGRMLLADAEARLGGVRVSDRFPVQLPWRPLALVPVGLAGVVLLALFWSPEAEANRPAEENKDLAVSAESKAAVEQKMKQLAARKPRDKNADKPDPDAKELEKIEAEIEKFARKPRDAREDIRERIKDATELEAEIKRQQEQQAGRVDALQEQAKQMERLKKKKREGQQGPAKDAADAVARADFDRARDELERLSRRLEKEEQKERLKRKIRDPKTSDEERKKAQKELEQLDREQNMTQKEREQLEKQLKEMEDQLKRLSRDQKEKEKELQEKKKEAEKKKQEAEKKKKDAEKKKKELEEKQKRGEGDKEELAQQKQEAEKKEKQAQQEKDDAEREQEELDREQDQLRKTGEQVSPEDLAELKKAADKLGECKDCVKEGKDGEAAKKLGEAGKQMDKMGQEGQQKALQQKLQQMREVRKALARSLGGDPAPASGRRPIAKDENTGHEEKSGKGEWDKSKVQGTGFGPMGGFKGPRKPSEMKEEIRQGAQEQAAAVDRQRLPASRRNLAKGFFEQMRGDEKDKKKR